MLSSVGTNTNDNFDVKFFIHKKELQSKFQNYDL